MNHPSHRRSRESVTPTVSRVRAPYTSSSLTSAEVLSTIAITRS
jgi:hypothetical protein